MKRPRFVARVLDSPTVRKIAPSTWRIWRKTPEAFRTWGYETPPPESGDLLVQSPYAQWYNLTWGLAPNQDMPKWRWMYRARPEVRRGIDVKVVLAVGRGFQIVCEEDGEVERYANQLLSHLGVRDLLQSAVTDMLVYGQAYFEKVRSASGDLQEHEKIEEEQLQQIGAHVTGRWSSDMLDKPDTATLSRWTADAASVDRWLAQETPKKKGNGSAAELVELKALDPLWIRVNRDAFNNVLGFVQWGLSPVPISLPPDKMVFLKWMPKSWSHESAYGTSILMPVQRHVSLLIQAEEDMKIWWHQYAKPMLVLRVGTPDRIAPIARIEAFRAKLAARGPTDDVVIGNDSELTMLKAGTPETTATFTGWITYLREKVYETLGVPSVLMNLPESGNRAVGDVNLQAFIAEQRMIQELVGEQFLKQVVLPEVERRFPDRFNRSPPVQLQIVWPPIMEEDRNKKMDRVTKAVGRPFMSVNEARAESGLPPLEGDEYDEIAPAPAPGFGQMSKPEPSESEETGPREEMLQKRDRNAEP